MRSPSSGAVDADAASPQAHDRWHPLVDEALAYRRNLPVRHPQDAGPARAHETATFALTIIDAAPTLPTPHP